MQQKCGKSVAVGERPRLVPMLKTRAAAIIPDN